MFFVWRQDHEDLKQQLKERDAELRRILDLMWKEGFGVTLFSKTDPTVATNTTTTKEPETSQVTPEDELERDRLTDNERLKSIARVSPSKLPTAMARVMQKRAAQLAAAVHPKRNNPAAKIFEEARKEVS